MHMTQKRLFLLFHVQLMIEKNGYNQLIISY